MYPEHRGFSLSKKGNGVSELSFLITGIGIGGPRNGVKLSAPPTWNGMVRKNPKNSNSPDTGDPYPGRYVYDPVVDAWVWTEPK